MLTAGWDLPIAAADEGTPVVVNCYQPPQVKPEHIILTCADNTASVAASKSEMSKLDLPQIPDDASGLEVDTRIAGRYSS